jgi:hypothetical protein
MRVAVFCGSSEGVRPAYADAARKTAQALHAAGLGLVYGGASVGLMGVLADEMVRLGGESIGVLPERLLYREIKHVGLTRLEIVQTMHERKARMAELADGFIALPGGTGTLEELFEVWTWALIGYHQKPMGLLDTDGYWDGLWSFLGHTVKEGFTKPEALSKLVTSADPVELVKLLNLRTPGAPTTR